MCWFANVVCIALYCTRESEQVRLGYIASCIVDVVFGNEGGKLAGKSTNSFMLRLRGFHLASPTAVEMNSSMSAWLTHPANVCSADRFASNR